VDPVGLSFVDLLYAVPVADLATRIADTHLQHVRASGWFDVLLALTAITFGWVGHHTNRQRMPEPLKSLRNSKQHTFTQLRFVQFLVEIVIIVAYFALGTRAVLPEHQGVAAPDEFWKGVLLVGIYGLYLVWDLLDIRIARREAGRQTDAGAIRELKEWVRRAKRGRTVTLAFVVLFAIFLAIGWSERHHKLGSVVAFDVGAIILLYAYRAIEEKAINRLARTPVAD
jgi:hypothetical protein